jgi:hypothetical protein
MRVTPTARHRRNCFARFFIVSIPAESVPELGTTTTLPLSPNHSALTGPFLGRKQAFALRLGVKLAALLGPQRAGEAERLAIGGQTSPFALRYAKFRTIA